ncbi:MAG: GNAT family N-acetyltransferase [Peptostreptococcaceae bacterium]|nr:GNAT family N-acetyltransferase [Peptostreptococcaceae bacterium]
MYIINESSDYEKLSRFFYDNGLEIEPDIERPENVVKCWECIDTKNNKLIGGASLEKRKEEFVVADMAVAGDYRKEKLGTKLMNMLEEEIIEMGGNEAWLVGKAPVFYLKLGWEIVERKNAPEISKCFTCSKFGNECNPEIMHKVFTENKQLGENWRLQL